MMAGVEDGCVAVFLVGWHAKAMAAGVLAHTINSTAFARVLVNGDEAGEARALRRRRSASSARRSRSYRETIACVAEAAALFPDAVGVAVKTAHGHRSATSLSSRGRLRRDRGWRAHGRAAHRDVAHRAAADASERARAGGKPRLRRSLRDVAARASRRRRHAGILVADDAPRGARAEQSVGDVVHASLNVASALAPRHAELFVQRPQRIAHHRQPCAEPQRGQRGERAVQREREWRAEPALRAHRRRGCRAEPRR